MNDVSLKLQNCEEWQDVYTVQYNIRSLNVSCNANKQCIWDYDVRNDVNTGHLNFIVVYLSNFLRFIAIRIVSCFTYSCCSLNVLCCFMHNKGRSWRLHNVHPSRQSCPLNCTLAEEIFGRIEFGSCIMVTTHHSKYLDSSMWGKQSKQVSGTCSFNTCDLELGALNVSTNWWMCNCNMYTVKSTKNCPESRTWWKTDAVMTRTRKLASVHNSWKVVASSRRKAFGETKDTIACRIQSVT